MNSDRSQLSGNAHDNLQLAIETTGVTGSLAVLQGETVLRQAKMDSGRRTAAVIAPVLAETLQWCRETKKWPQLISIANGPGSFTGLRIGVTTAKSVGYAADLPLIAVDSLAAIAAATFQEQLQINDLLVGINAYRGQVFTAKFQRSELLPPLTTLSGSAGVADDRAHSESSGWSTHPDQVRIVDADEWEQILDAAQAGDWVTGEAKVFRRRSDLSFATRVSADAVGVGLLAVRASILGAWSDPLELVPRYLKPSAAEEKADQVSKAIKRQSV